MMLHYTLMTEARKNSNEHTQNGQTENMKITELLRLGMISGDHPVQSLTTAGSPGAGEVGIHPGVLRMSLERETPHPLCET